MLYDGREFRRAPHLTFRNADPERDVDHKGNPVKSNYCIIVPVSHCEVKDGIITYDSIQAAKGLQGMVYTGTNTMLGDYRYNNGIREIGGEMVKGYYTRPKYLVYKGRVYTTTLYYKVKK